MCYPKTGEGETPLAAHQLQRRQRASRRRGRWQEPLLQRGWLAKAQANSDRRTRAHHRRAPSPAAPASAVPLSANAPGGVDAAPALWLEADSARRAKHSRRWPAFQCAGREVCLAAGGHRVAEGAQPEDERRWLNLGARRQAAGAQPLRRRQSLHCEASSGWVSGADASRLAKLGALLPTDRMSLLGRANPSEPCFVLRASNCGYHAAPPASTSTPCPCARRPTSAPPLPADV